MFLLVATLVFAAVAVEQVESFTLGQAEVQVIIIYTCYNYIYYYGTVHI